jgi:proteasome-associated ATPase
MSEFDSGSSRKGFVRDVMRRISSSGPRDDENEATEMGRERAPGRSYQESVEDLQDAVRLFGVDSAEFRRRLDRLMAEFEALRRRYHLTREQCADAERQNERLVGVLQEAKQQIELLKEEVDKLCAPPNNYGIFQRANKDGTAEIIVDGRPMRVNTHPDLDPFQFEEGQHVVLNEAFNVVEPSGYVSRGEIGSIVDFLGDHRAIVLGHTDDERVVTLAEPLRSEKLKVGDHILFDTRTHYAFEKLPKSSVEEVVLEEIPDVTYDNIGGLGEQIESLRDSVELPYIYPDVFAEHKLAPPKGILLYGPPGCGKTLIAKAVANSLARSVEFLNVKGPELLNKYVGETEHKLREVFKKARDKASEDVPVVIFFDEMDSLFRMRGSGISSDMEATVVAQFLSEIDGVESLKNVIVIGASNRQDLIDPAVLRPGRLDLKIKVHRPDAAAAREIFFKYLTPDLPFHESANANYGGDPERIVSGMITDTIARIGCTRPPRRTSSSRSPTPRESARSSTSRTSRAAR